MYICYWLTWLVNSMDYCIELVFNLFILQTETLVDLCSTNTLPDKESFIH